MHEDGNNDAFLRELGLSVPSYDLQTQVWSETEQIKRDDLRNKLSLRYSAAWLDFIFDQCEL